jgi:hypothetical protein
MTIEIVDLAIQKGDLPLKGIIIQYYTYDHLKLIFYSYVQYINGVCVMDHFPCDHFLCSMTIFGYMMTGVGGVGLKRFSSLGKSWSFSIWRCSTAIFFGCLVG